MYRVPLWPGSLPLDIIVLPPMLAALVRLLRSREVTSYSYSNTYPSVRVWDMVGEDQTLKGEYKVIGGRVCVVPLIRRLLLSWNATGGKHLVFVCHYGGGIKPRRAPRSATMPATWSLSSRTLDPACVCSMQAPG